MIRGNALLEVRVGRSTPSSPRTCRTLKNNSLTNVAVQGVQTADPVDMESATVST